MLYPILKTLEDLVMYVRILNHAARSSTSVSLLALGVFATSMGMAAPVPHNTPCESLLQLKLPDTTVTIAKLETSETYHPPAWDEPGPPAPSTKDLPSFCRVTADIRPTADSEIKIELWMPASGWNSKFMGIGNGAWSGRVWRVID
jgi:hypothetical protein